MWKRRGQVLQTHILLPDVCLQDLTPNPSDPKSLFSGPGGGRTRMNPSQAGWVRERATRPPEPDLEASPKVIPAPHRPPPDPPSAPPPPRTEPRCGPAPP